MPASKCCMAVRLSFEEQHALAPLSMESHAVQAWITTQSLFERGTTIGMSSKRTGPASRVRTHRDRFTDLDPDKLRGGYYTSPELAGWLSSWAIRSARDRVLEPSCGDGVFLDAAANRLKKVGLEGGRGIDHLFGIEILEVEAAKARWRLKSHFGRQAGKMVETGDFFAWWQPTERNYSGTPGWACLTS